jgi:hypothetical protein
MLARVLQDIHKADQSTKIALISPSEIAVWAGPEKQLVIERWLRNPPRPAELRVPYRAPPPGPRPSLKFYSTPARQAEPLAHILQKVYKGDPVTRIAMVDPNRIVVWAVPEWQQAIARYLKALPRSSRGRSLLPGGNSDEVATLKHKCIFVKAEDAKKDLELHLGDKPVKGAKQVRFKVTADEETNTVCVRGPAKLIGKAKAFLASIDKGRIPRTLPSLFMQRYTVREGQAERLTKILQLYQGGEVAKVAAVSPNTIVVWADPEDQMCIERYLRILDAPGKGATLLEGPSDGDEPFLAAHPVPTGQAKPLVQILQKVYKGDPVTKVALVDPNTLAVWAVPEWQQAIATYLKALPRRSRGSRPGA